MFFLRGAAAAGVAAGSGVYSSAGEGDAPTRARRRLAQVLRWVVCELLRVCVDSGWHGCARERSL